MNLMQIIHAAAAPQLSARPEGSLGGAVIVAAVVGALIAFGIASPPTKKPGRRRLAFAIISVAAVAAITGAINFTVRDSARYSAEQTAWDASTTAWAADRYGVSAGMASLHHDLGLNLFFLISDCPTDNGCYTGKVLIGDTLTPVALVFIDDTPILVSGDRTASQKELPLAADRR